jgi:hypothetical protein
MPANVTRAPLLPGRRPVGRELAYDYRIAVQRLLNARARGASAFTVSLWARDVSDHRAQIAAIHFGRATVTTSDGTFCTRTGAALASAEARFIGHDDEGLAVYRGTFGL